MSREPSPLNLNTLLLVPALALAAVACCSLAPGTAGARLIGGEAPGEDDVCI